MFNPVWIQTTWTFEWFQHKIEIPKTTEKFIIVENCRGQLTAKILLLQVKIIFILNDIKLKKNLQDFYCIKPRYKV